MTEKKAVGWDGTCKDFVHDAGEYSFENNGKLIDVRKLQNDGKDVAIFLIQREGALTDLRNHS